MSVVELNWSSAEVRDGALEVGLRGELPAGWKDSFVRTVALLGGGDWGKIKLKKDRVLVSTVAEGGENRLHHFLESVVLQANAGHEQTQPDDDPDADEDTDEPNGIDAEMTERFRSFGKSPGD